MTAKKKKSKKPTVRKLEVKELWSYQIEEPGKKFWELTANDTDQEISIGAPCGETYRVSIDVAVELSKLILKRFDGEFE